MSSGLCCIWEGRLSNASVQPKETNHDLTRFSTDKSLTQLSSRGAEAKVSVAWMMCQVSKAVGGPGLGTARWSRDVSCRAPQEASDLRLSEAKVGTGGRSQVGCEIQDKSRGIRLKAPTPP